MVLSFTRGWWHNSSRVIAPAMFISLMFGIIDGVKASAFADILPQWTASLPLAAQGLAWLLPTAVMAVLAAIIDRAAVARWSQKPTNRRFTQVFNHGT